MNLRKPLFLTILLLAGIHILNLHASAGTVIGLFGGGTYTSAGGYARVCYTDPYKLASGRHIKVHYQDHDPDTNEDYKGIWSPGTSRDFIRGRLTLYEGSKFLKEIYILAGDEKSQNIIEFFYQSVDGQEVINYTVKNP